MKSVQILCLVLLALTRTIAEDEKVSKRDFTDFYLSSAMKDEIKAEIVSDLNLTLDAAKTELLNQIKSETELHQRLRNTQIDEIKSQLTKLKEEIDFARELAVDANYMRNSNADVVATLQKRVEELDERLKTLEALIKNETPQPEIPESGRKL
jgi:thermostable 8-oxoguanine DNA glycosylase